MKAWYGCELVNVNYKMALSLLKEDIARKRKAIADKKLEKGKKYMKRSELESSQEDAEEGRSRTPSLTSPTELVSPTSLPSIPVDDSPIFNMPRSEVVKRLRERGEPIRLFGETDRDTCLRLRQIEILAPEVNKGLRNDLKAAMDQLNQDELDQLAEQQGDEGAESNFDLKVKDDGLTIDAVSVMAENELGKGDTDHDQEIILKILKFLMKEWAWDLNTRPDAVKRSTQGKLFSATYKQTESYLTPLFRMLKKKITHPDILEYLAQICSFIVKREYVKANDTYLQMAIGNAPWPIGVTMVGIHARTGREKIFAKSIAHVLNDETQRKYIQGVKRLMTFCQRKFETAPSKCVEYKGINN